MGETETDTKVSKTKVANKEWLGTDGSVVEDQELATGIRYESIADGKVYDYQIPEAIPGKVCTMLAVFGATTLATNFASQNRNSATAAGRFASDADAVQDRLEKLVDNDWGAGGGEGGRGIDIDVLLAAAVESNPDNASKAEKLRAKFEADPAFRATIKNHSAIAPIYVRLLAEKRGRKEDDIDDLFAVDDDSDE